MDQPSGIFESKTSKRPSRRAVFFSVFFTVVVMLVPVFYFLHSGGRPGSHDAVSRISGRVLNEKRQALPGAQVVVAGDGTTTPQITYVDEQGIFLVVVPSSVRIARLTVSAAGYESYARELQLQGGSQLEEMILTPIPELTHAHEPPREQRDDSGLVPSGPGANWSNWYRVCSTTAPQGFRVSSSSFFLEGDRRCNAWSECQEESRNDSQVCWRFRLQGHSEAVFQNEGRALSRGVLLTTLEHAPEVQPHNDRYGVVYIQFSGEQNRQVVQELRQELVKNGYRAPGVQRLDFQFPNSVKYFNDADGENASGLATIVSSFLNARHSPLAVVPAVRASSDATVPAGQMEVWLSFPPPQH
jgi:hypothetical protein